jgi:tRNA(fMet)-specific endonuclease VapC
MVYGLAKLPASRKKDAIRAYLEDVVLKDVVVFPYDLAAARWHGDERARLEKLGRPTSFRDAQIAAVAKVRGLILVTANLKDFRGLSGLELESWM